MNTIQATLVEILRMSRSRDEVRRRIGREFADREPTVPFLEWRASRREVAVHFAKGDVQSVTAECTDGFVEDEPEPVAESTGNDGSVLAAMPVLVLRIGRRDDPMALTGPRKAAVGPN